MLKNKLIIVRESAYTCSDSINVSMYAAVRLGASRRAYTGSGASVSQSIHRQ